MVIGGPEANVCRECLDRKLTNACPLGGAQCARPYRAVIIWKDGILDPLEARDFSSWAGMFSLNWIDWLTEKKSVKKIWKKSRVKRGHEVVLPKKSCIQFCGARNPHIPSNDRQQQQEMN